MTNEVLPEPTLKSYKGPWNKKGPLLLVCRKCERKLPRKGHSLSRMSKLVKKRSKKLGFLQKLLIVQTPCLRVCPREGVTVCTQAQVGRGECSILRQPADIDLLVLQCMREAEPLVPVALAEV